MHSPRMRVIRPPHEGGETSPQYPEKIRTARSASADATTNCSLIERLPRREDHPRRERPIDLHGADHPAALGEARAATDRFRLLAKRLGCPEIASTFLERAEIEDDSSEQLRTCRPLARLFQILARPDPIAGVSLTLRGAGAAEAGPRIAFRDPSAQAYPHPSP